MQSAKLLRPGIWVSGILACTIGVAGWAVQSLSAPPPSFARRDTDGALPAGQKKKLFRTREGYARLSHFQSSWSKVLQDLADQTGSKLVADSVPRGNFTRRDRREYTRLEAVRILNRTLEPKGFRIVERQENLVVLNLRNLRTRYQRPVMPSWEEDARRRAQAGGRGSVQTADYQRGSRPYTDVQTINPREALDRTPSYGSGRYQPELRSPFERNVRRAAHDGPGVMPNAERARPIDSRNPLAGSNNPLHHAYREQSTPRRSPVSPARSQPRRRMVSTVRTTHRRAADVARQIHLSLKSRSKLIDRGPGGLPAFAVAASKTAVQFAVGINTGRDELVIEAEEQSIKHVEGLIRTLDEHDSSRGAIITLVESRIDPTLIARRLQPTLDVLARNRVVRTAQNQNQPQPKQPMQPAGRQPMGTGQPNVTKTVPKPGDQGKGDPLEGPAIQIPGLRGPVTIRDVPGVGLVLTGASEDVEAVLKIIRELDRFGQGATPSIHLLMLRHVNSEALTALLNDVYAQLAEVRARGSQTQKLVSIVPVIKPNAILIIANKPDLDAVLKLADELDQPVDPSTEFQVYHLKFAVASQVVTQIEALYGNAAAQAGTGRALRTRVQALADVRTNSVIVQARPRDLLEIMSLIRKLDRDANKTVMRMRIFKLKNALSDELATTLNTAIQSVIGTPTTPTGQAAGQANQQLVQAKSAIVELLTSNGAMQRLVRSGILADIRVTSDARINALVVSAPEQSMVLMEALILQLDQPSNTVAEIKVFTLANADSTAMSELLTNLFTQQQNQANQNQVGIQVAGADDASSSLIPIRFSVDARTNSIIAIGGAEALRVVEAVILRLDGNDSRTRKKFVIKLRNAPAADVALAIQQFLQAQRELANIDPNLVTNAEILESEVIVVAEAVSNSLLVSATPRYEEEIRKLIGNLDEAPPEVVIQALLVEVELDNTDEFGVELGVQDRLLFDRSLSAAEDLVTLSSTNTSPNGVQTTTQNIISQSATPGFPFNNQPLGNNIAANPLQVGSQGLSNFSLGRVNGDLGFGGLVLSASSAEVSVLLRALAAKRTVHVLSRPQIRVTDNQLAQIQVGQEVPVINGFSQLNAQTGSLTPVVERQPAGIILTVSPRIRPDGTVVMELVAEKSAFTGQGVPLVTDPTTGNTIEAPIKDITTARSTVSVPNGQTIVVGGMITKSDDTIERKVPWLGDIPLLGAAFRYDSTRTLRTELLIFLTPRIIKSDADSELIKQVEAERLHFIESDAENIHGPLFGVPAEQQWLNQMCPVVPQGTTMPQGTPRAPAVEQPAPRLKPNEVPPLPNNGGNSSAGNVPTTVVPAGGYRRIPDESTAVQASGQSRSPARPRSRSPFRFFSRK